jgi:outer membrane lipoprotein SlyB
MKRSTFATAAMAVVFVVSVTGCTGQMVQTAAGPMPDYCTTGVSNAAGGAVLGSILGAAIGAAAAGGRGAALGAIAGAAAGGLTGAQMEANCRQAAMQNFMQLMAQQAAAQRAAMARGAGPQVSPSDYQSFDYYTPSPNAGQPPVRRRLTQTGGYTDRATNETCSAYTEFSYSDNGASAVAGTGRICTGPDGRPRAA